MKRILFALVLAFLTTSVASAECPGGETYCNGWRRVDQAQKARVETMDAAIKAHAAMLADCDDVTIVPEFGKTCIQNYNDASRGILYKLADVNKLPREKVVLFSIVEAWDWGNQATIALGRPLVQADWDLHAAAGLVSIAQRLNVNSPIKIFDNDSWCLLPDYGGAGTCGGNW